MAYHFKNLDATTNTLQLKSTEKALILNEWRDFEANVAAGTIQLEPEYQFEAVHPFRFKDDGDFDFVVLSQSPRFTPKASDGLIPVIERYMELEAPRGAPDTGGASTA